MSALPIDIVVPVYNAADDLAACIASVRRHTARGTYRLILIDDGSPDPRIAARFAAERAAADPDTLLLHNERNLGFVRTVNRGMALSDRHDVLLLNSDTLVTAGWLAKIAAAAAVDPRIATITPYSNNAEICSIPRFCADNRLADLPPLELLNRACELAGAGTVLDIPTGVGFCMYIRRAALAQLGGFDAETFGLGYGEENDFCMRALHAGWRNVLAADTFVAHTGGRSFDERKRQLMEGALARLVAKHPDYPQRVQRYIAADPQRPLRDLLRVTLRRLASAGQTGVLHVMHAREGGTLAHVLDLARGGGDAARHLRLIADGDHWRIEDEGVDPPAVFELVRAPDEPWAELLNAVCDSFGIDLVHFHHLSGARAGLLLAAAGLRRPYGVTLHDEYLMCPTITLLDARGEYCGAVTDAARCTACLNAQPGLRGLDIVAWRREHEAFLRGARFIIAPSGFVAATAQRYFPGLAVQVVPHGVAAGGAAFAVAEAAAAAAAAAPPGAGHVIGVLGAIGPVKGARRLERLVARTRERALPLRWVVIGYTDVQYQPLRSADGIYTVHGRYQAHELGALLARYGVDLVVFPSQGPESFSYTLSEAWLHGHAPLVPDFGALGERVRATGAGWLMHDPVDADAILDQVLAILAPAARDEYAARRVRARAWMPDSVATMARRTAGIYSAVCAAASGAVLADGAAAAASAMALGAADTTEVGAASMRAAGTAARAAPRATVLPLRRRLIAGATVSAAADANAPAAGRDFWLVRAGAVALRLRHTAPGRWLYRTLPVRWQQRLKARLLAR